MIEVERLEKLELENTIQQLEYCAENIFQDEYYTAIQRLVKKASKKMEMISND